MLRGVAQRARDGPVQPAGTTINAWEKLISSHNRPLFSRGYLTQISDPITSSKIKTKSNHWQTLQLDLDSMAAPQWPPAGSVALCALLLTLGYMLIQRAYPRPLHGIPYNRDAARRLAGDFPELAAFGKKGGSFRQWFLEQATRHNSAITQVFLSPFAKPAVIVSDYREVYDILSHRDGLDFKRGKKADAFAGTLPHTFPAMETFDPLFKSSRDLARDLMMPSVLNSVNAPRIHDVSMSLLELCRLKAGLACGKPFDVADDVNEFGFDAILSAALGLGPDGGDVNRQIQHITTHQDRAVSHKESIVVFSRAKKSAKLSALQVEEDSLWKAFLMPFPKLYHSINDFRPSVRRAKRTMRAHIASQIANNLEVPGKQPECALDYVMQRELRAAEKAGRAPVLDDPRIVNPVYGYLIAGHDTSSGTLLWLLRRMTAHPEYQSRVRACLRATYAEAWTEKRLPTAAELARQHSPWLDAALEETLRLDAPVVNILVVTKTDTTVLGHFLPKDTPVFLNLTGASLSRPSVPVDDTLRRESSSAHPAQRESWDAENPDIFKPERWLKHEDSGRLLFDASAGPALAFSAGNRGCYGKRLGLLELRIVATLLIWSFEFGQVPEELVSSETFESLVTAPKECLVRLTEVAMA